jgi:PAS domain S-box-containing protein
MRVKILGQIAKTIAWALTALLVSMAMQAPIEAIANEPTPQSGEQKQTEQDRCKFLMDKVNGIILSLSPEGRITFVNHYGQSFFGYSAEEILGKPMLGTLTPLAGYEGRDLASFLSGVVHDPSRYAFSVNENMLRDGKRVWIFWANNGISDEQGEVLEVLRIGLNITERKLRLQAFARELRGIGEMLEGRSWVQRSKLKEITSRIEEISRELERPWAESDAGGYESVAPPNH